MKTSKTLRSLAAAGCTVGSACVSGPQPRPPPPEDCPPGAYESMHKLGLIRGDMGALFPPFDGRVRVMPVQEGSVTVQPNGGFKDGSRLSGRIYIGTDRVYGRFTELRLPGGEVVPVCMEMFPAYESPIERGVPLEKGSTAGRPLIFSSVSLRYVERLE